MKFTMKKFATLSLLGMFAGSLAFGQSSQSHVATQAQMDQQVTYDALLKQKLKDEALLTAKTIDPVQDNNVSAYGTAGTVNPVELGRSSNAYSILRCEQNQVSASDDLNLVAFIHRHDVTIYGGGTAENGKYRYDLSTDGGSTFTNDIGVLNQTYTLRTRYPNITTYNTGGNTNPFNANLVYGGPTLSAATGWDGHVYGVSDINTGSATATENYEFNGASTLLPGGLTEGLPGEYWSVDWSYDGSAYMDSLFVYKGTWNSGTGDVDWVRFASVVPPHDKTYDGTISMVGPNIAASPDGQDIWIAWLGDLTSGTANYNLLPVFMGSTDGGATWGNPTEVDLDAISWIGDSLTSFWTTIDTVTGDTIPAGTGLATCGFDFDLTVDGNGNPHLAVVIGNGADGGGYSISSGLEKFIGDVTSPDGGATWDVNYIGAVNSFRGEFGTPDPQDGSLLTVDNFVQTSRTEDGSRIFFSWMDSDSMSIGFGETANLAPNLRLAGLRVADGFQTPVVKVTDGDFIWEGRVLCPTMAPTVLTKSGGNYELPIVAIDMITNDQLQPCKYWYFGADATLNDACFAAPSTLELGIPGHVDKDNLACITSIEEAIAREGLSHTIFPNPAMNSAVIRFDLPESAEVQYNVMNLYGQTVIEGGSALYSAGMNDIQVNTSELASGVYFYNLVVGEQVFSNKLVINR